MTATNPNTGYREGIAQVTESVFATMLDLVLQPESPSPAPGPAELTAAVYFAGAWKGAVLLECSLDQAKAWASKLMSLPAPVPAEDARDALGELCNVLAGNLKPLLPPGVGLSTPSVVRGSDYNLKVCGETRIDRLEFTDGLGGFRVSLIVG